MKKINKLVLSPSQLLDEEDMNKVVAGDNWYHSGYSWSCGCLEKDDVCYEVDYYMIFKSSGSDNFFQMTSHGVICNPADLIGTGRIYNVWICDGVYNSNKTHHLGGRYRAKRII